MCTGYDVFYGAVETYADVLGARTCAGMTR
jgi:hypothetical protein